MFADVTMSDWLCETLCRGVFVAKKWATLINTKYQLLEL